MIHITIFILIIIIGWLSNKEIQKIHEQKNELEQELAVKRALFEAKILERSRQLQELRIKHLSQLERTAEFGRLSEGLFHDLMNPLTAVALHVEQLNKDSHPHAESTTTHIKKAVSASSRMIEFMKQIRTYIQTERISLPHKNHYESIPILQHKKCDVRHELQTSIDLLAYKARHAGVTIEVICEQPCHIYTSPMYIHQVFLNLIANAIEAFPSKEDTARREPTPESNTHHSNKIIVTITPTTIIVSDNARGIPAEYLQHIFKPFFTTKSTEQGTGIGLHTVQEIVVNNLQGNIRVTSAVGVGTTFTITYRP